MKTSISILPSLLLLAVAADAETLNVPGDHGTIQAAIDAAWDGDTVLVAPGSYPENIDFLGKAITVKSSDGAGVTTIDGGYPSDPNHASVVTFANGEGPDSVLDGFELEDGTGTLVAGFYCGGGIYVTGGSSPTIIDNTIAYNVAHWGAGIAVELYSDPLIANCTLTRNVAIAYGGGIWIGDHSSPTITNATIAINTEMGGAEVAIEPTCAPELTNTIVWADQGFSILDGGGGMVVVDHCDVKGGWPLGTNNLDADPGFADPAVGDFHLTDGSPCVDAGNDGAPGLPTHDFEGDPRISGLHADIGADELVAHIPPPPFIDISPIRRVLTPVVADAFVDEYAPDTNKGTGQVLRVRNHDGYAGGDDYSYDLLVEFDLGSIPVGTPIGNATLMLYYEGWHDTDPAGRPLTLHRTTGGWVENAVTWNTRPTVNGTPTDVAIVPPAPDVWMQWDVTADVQAMIDGTVANHGWQLSDETPWNDHDIPVTNFTPRESGNRAPRLVVTCR